MRILPDGGSGGGCGGGKKAQQNSKMINANGQDSLNEGGNGSLLLLLAELNKSYMSKGKVGCGGKWKILKAKCQSIISES